MRVAVDPSRLRIRIDGFAPQNDPLYASSRSARIAFWDRAGQIAVEVKRRELAAGLDKDGVALAPLKPITIRMRKSKMGPVIKGSPPLDPAGALSRTIAWLRSSPDESGVTLFWVGRGGRVAWSKVLGFHAGIGGRVKNSAIRNVFGLSLAGMVEVETRTKAWWNRYRSIELSPSIELAPVGKAAGRTPFDQARAERKANNPDPSRFAIPYEHIDFHTGSQKQLDNADFFSGFSQKRSPDSKPPSTLGAPKRDDSPLPPRKPRISAIAKKARAEIDAARAEALNDPAHLSGSTIREKLANDKIGDKQIQMIQYIYHDFEKKTARIEAKKSILDQKIQDVLHSNEIRSEADHAAFDKLVQQSNRLIRRKIDARIEINQQILKSLEVKEPQTIRIVVDRSSSPNKLPSADQIKLARSAASALSRLVARRTDPSNVTLFKHDSKDLKDRSYFERSSQSIHMIADHPISTYLHELTHFLEQFQNVSGEESGRSGASFRDERSEGEKPSKLKEVAGFDFTDEEFAVSDEFERALGEKRGWYAGKIYQDPRVSEILSSGVEKLFSDAYDFSVKDPEYLKLILRFLDGSM